MNITPARLSVRAERPSLCASRRITSATVLTLPAQTRWQRPTVQQAAPARPTPASNAYVAELIEDFKRTPYGRAWLNHPNPEWVAAKLFEYCYTQKMPRDFFRDDCHNGEAILNANKPSSEVERTVNSYYDAYGYNRLYISPRSGR